MVTGARTGIGQVTALELARMGAAVVMVCRTAERGEEARHEVMRASGNGSVDLMICDLSSRKQVRRLASEYKIKHDRLHVLVNNAGVVLRRRTLSEEGIEMQLAVNHLAPFLLTNLLLDVLKAGVPSRVVTLSSGMYRTASLDLGNLQGEKSYKAMRQYALTKLLNIYFTYELSRRLEGTGVTANCLGPGFTATDLGRDFSAFSQLGMRILGKKKERGARTGIYLASSSEVEAVTGKYFENSKAIPTSAPTYDRETARDIWQISEKMTGLAGR